MMKYKSKCFAESAVVTHESFLVSSIEALAGYFNTASILSGCVSSGSWSTPHARLQLGCFVLCIDNWEAHGNLLVGGGCMLKVPSCIMQPVPLGSSSPCAVTRWFVLSAVAAVAIVSKFKRFLHEID